MPEDANFGAAVAGLRPYQKNYQYPLTTSLRALAAVSKSGSITRAVADSDYTLEGMLVSLRNLEMRENIRLLTRSVDDQRSLTLTPAGERLASWAIEWFRSLDKLLNELQHDD